MLIEVMSVVGTLAGMWTSHNQREADLKKEKLSLERLGMEHVQELKLREFDLQQVEREAAANIRIAETSAFAAESAADAQLIQASIQSDSKMLSEGMKHTKTGIRMFEYLDVFRGSVRPSLTYFITVAYSIISIVVIRRVLQEDSVNHYALAEQSLGMLSYSMNSVVSHYFGTRNKSSEAISRKRSP